MFIVHASRLTQLLVYAANRYISALLMSLKVVVFASSWSLLPLSIHCSQKSFLSFNIWLLGSHRQLKPYMVHLLGEWGRCVIWKACLFLCT
ncbi:hypothetical protein B0T21DRAFT_379148 [Apiosordaria backusii]|uniref:Uncharacterized protein n=1 Tax=Apiosordaria backusii TaxID=314023 RepID=A0AA39ZPB9_9PEZI|nr:hypothetical protein B0T21DRAFT_379148 [Apiosordaria backusii]